MATQRSIDGRVSSELQGAGARVMSRSAFLGDIIPSRGGVRRVGVRVGVGLGVSAQGLRGDGARRDYEYEYDYEYEPTGVLLLSPPVSGWPGSRRGDLKFPALILSRMFIRS